MPKIVAIYLVLDTVGGVQQTQTQHHAIAQRVSIRSVMDIGSLVVKGLGTWQM